MKKFILMCLLALCMVTMLTLGVSAEGTSPDPATLPHLLLGAEGGIASTSPVITNLTRSFLSIVPGINRAINVYLPTIVEAVVYMLITIVLLSFAAFGYRSLTLMRAALGAVAGALTSFLAWRFLTSLSFVPVSILRLDAVFVWLAILVFLIIGATFTVLLGRFGTAVSVAALVSICVLPCVRSVWMLAAVFAVIFILSVIKSRASVILLTSFALPTFLLFLLIGPNGCIPLDLGGMVTPVLNPILFLGLFVGTVFSIVHFRVSRRVRA